MQFFSCDDKREVYIHFTKIPGELLKASLFAPKAFEHEKLLIFMKTGKTTNISGQNINDAVLLLEWSKDTLDYFESLTRNLFLTMLYNDDSMVVSADRVMELLHRILSASQVMVGRLRVGLIFKTEQTGNQLMLLLKIFCCKVLKSTCSISIYKIIFMNIVGSLPVWTVSFLKSNMKFLEMEITVNGDNSVLL